MANKTFSVPITTDSVFQAAATASGSVSGDTTTITSIALNVPDDMWALAVTPDDFPTVTIIDGKQYRWTIKAKKTTLGGGTYVQKATLNIGTKLVINKPFFTIKYGANPVSDPSECVRSFYDLGRLTYYEWDPGASDIEITGNESVPLNVESGDDSISIKLTTDATYRFTWTLKNKTYSNTKKLAAKATRITNSYKIPKLWNEELPSSTYGWMDLKIESIFGTQVYQTITKQIKVTVPDDCVPVINSVTVADKAGRVPASWNMFVEEQSNVGLSAVSVTPSYGSAIVSVTMEVDDKTYTGTPTSLPTSKIFDTYGVKTITVTVKDQRGRTAEKSARITVVEYDPPTLSVDSIRCGSDGSIENEGVYFLAMTDTTYSTCNGKNSLTLTVAYKLTSNWTYGTPKTISPGEGQTAVCGGDLDTEFSYDVKYVLKDQFNTVTVIDFVSTAVYLMHFLHGGRGVAFGSKATRENYADFAFNAIFRGTCEFEKPNGETVTIAQIIEKLGL